MTLIGGKQINNKWTLFTDDCVTVGQARISAANRYRPKLREIVGKNAHLIIASCGSTKDVDFTLNMLEAAVCSHKSKDTLDLQYQIQNVLMNSMKTLKEIKEDPSFSFLILEVESNTLWATEEYSMFYVKDSTDIVFGSGEQGFHKVSHKGFVKAFTDAVATNEYCEFPIYVYRDGKMFVVDNYDDIDEFEDFLFGLDKDGPDTTDYSAWGEDGLTGPEAEKLG